MACIVKDSGLAHRAKKVRFIDLLPGERRRFWVDLTEGREFLNLGRTAILGCKTKDAVAPWPDCFRQQKMRQIWADQDWKLLNQIFRFSRAAEHFERQPM